MNTTETRPLVSFPVSLPPSPSTSISHKSAHSRPHVTVCFTLAITTLLSVIACSIVLSRNMSLTAISPARLAHRYISYLLTSTDSNQRFDLIVILTVSFGLLYSIAYCMWRMIPGTGLQSPTLAKIAASRCISTTHAALVVCLGMITIQRQLVLDADWNEIQTLRQNTALEQRILEISAGFFIVDIVVLLMNTKCRLNDQQSILLFCHHIISLTFMLTVGYWCHAGSMVMVGLIFAECTSPLVTMWTLARATKSSRHLKWTSPLFTITFSLMRFVGMTTMFIDATPKLLLGLNPGQVPFLMRATWFSILFLLCLGGWIWAYEAQKGLKSYYRKQRLTKMQVAPLDAIPSSPSISPFLSPFTSPQSTPRVSLSLNAPVCG